MKARIREVNIFSLSLLDILCGALGAFCFLMLTLFPDHLRAKVLEEKLAALENVREERDKARAEQTLVYFKVAWSGAHDVDLWLLTPNGKYWVPKPGGLSKERVAGQFRDKTKGPDYEAVWFSDVARAGQRYRLFARLASRGGASGAVRVNGYISARVPRGDGSAMGVYDLGLAELGTIGQVRELGSIRFEDEDFRLTVGPSADARPGS